MFMRKYKFLSVIPKSTTDSTVKCNYPVSFKAIKIKFDIQSQRYE
jgi:hypothetical protein